MKLKSNSLESLGGLVFSTNREIKLNIGEPVEETPPPENQALYISLDKSGRKGKVVTLVEGFEGSADSLESLARSLKKFCGAGGSAKDGGIIIQGDFKQKTAAFLEKEGYKVKQKGGR